LTEGTGYNTRADFSKPKRVLTSLEGSKARGARKLNLVVTFFDILCNILAA